MKKIEFRSYVLLPLLLLGAAAAGPLAGQGYRIGARDQVEIRVFEMPELNSQLRVTEDGTINLPQIGELALAGKTEAQAAQSLKTLLETKYVNHATVEIRVLEFRSRPITVIGAVRKPGPLDFSGRWTLLEALTAAGGVGENHGRVLYVLRRADNGLSDQVAINLDELIERADPRANIPLLANDLINVPTAVEVTIYCLGELVRPGAIVFKSTDRITLLAAIAHAGGLTDRASKTIHIRRAEAAPGTPEIVADYKRILAGKERDVELQSGDVVVVKESFF